MNVVIMRGTIMKPIEWSHTSHESHIFRMWMDVLRLSGKSDTLRVFAAEDVLHRYEPQIGDTVEITGQMRTYNNKSGVGGKLIVSALAHKIEPEAGEHINKVLVSGTICRTPGYRKTPLGREICDLMLAVPRAYSRTDYLPMIAWGSTARECATMNPGDPLFVEGRFQSRGYTKIIDGVSHNMTAYEISIVKLLESEEALAEANA